MPVRLIRHVVVLAMSLSVIARAADSWKALGPFGGSAALVQSDPNSGRVLLAGTSNALLFRSLDGGDSWTALRFPPQRRATLHALAIHPRIRNLWMAGVSPETPGESGMWISGDGGSTWLPVPVFANTSVWAIAVFRGNGEITAAGADTGVFPSRDGGVAWHRISPVENRELQPVVSVAFDPKNARILYAGTPHLPWKTVDEGRTWTSIHNGMIDDSDVFSILVDRNRPQRIFAGACSGVYRSFNGGTSWGKLPEAKEASFRTYTLVQDPQRENVLFAGTTHGMIRSTDGGGNWERIAHYATRSIAFDLSRLGRIFIATDDAGILRSEDHGRTWGQLKNGFSNLRLGPLALGGDGALLLHDPADGAAFRLAEDSVRWTKVRPPALPALAGGARLTGLLVSAWDSKGAVAAAGPYLYSQRDASRGWRMLQFPYPIRSVVALDPSWVAAVAGSAVYLSTDGEHWQGGRALEAEVHDVVAMPGKLVAATAAGLRVSIDRGESWRRIGGPLEESTIQAICRHPERSSVLFAAHYGEVLSSVDGGVSWKRISPADWPVDSVRQLMVIPKAPDRLFVLTAYQGVFQLPIAP